MRYLLLAAVLLVGCGGEKAGPFFAPEGYFDQSVRGEGAGVSIQPRRTQSDAGADAGAPDGDGT